jgi:AcrR family transcriptional regulator
VPRVSEAHLTARREQILEAARRCFLRNGFHRTSMQDVIAEAGLSVGAVYRYFPSKNDIIIGIADLNAGQVADSFAALVEDPERSLVDVMQAAVGVIEENTGPDGLARIAVQIWAEAMRDETMAALADRVYRMLRENFVRLARRAITTGELPHDADPEITGAALFALLLGYAVQRLLTGQPDPEAYRDAVRTLLTSATVTTAASAPS